MFITITTACHTAILDPLVGLGVLLLPDPVDDVAVSMPSLHGADHDAMIGELRARGWTPLLDEGDLPLLLDDRIGRTVVALGCDEPIDEAVSPDRWVAAEHELLAALPA